LGESELAQDWSESMRKNELGYGPFQALSRKNS
jgi:hypothetical protein